MKPRIIITNKSAWSTRDLRKLIVATLKVNSKEEGPFRQTLRITIVSKRGGNCGSGGNGYASLGYGSMRLRLPRESIDVRYFCWLFEHELMHCRGYDHNRFGAFLMHGKGVDTDPRYAFADGVTVSPKAAPKPKTAQPKDVQAQRYARVCAALERNEAKVKRLTRAAKKLRTRKAYYERALAKRATTPKAPPAPKQPKPYEVPVKFLEEVAFALDMDVDENDMEPCEVERFTKAKADAEKRVASPELIDEALSYMTGIKPDWIYYDRAVRRRWCSVMAHFNKLERCTHPGVAREDKITINAVTYYVP